MSWLVSKIASAVLFDVAFRQRSIVLEHDLGVTKWAMLELEVLELLVQGLMLADLAHVVLFDHDAHATCDARRVVRTTLLTVDVTKQIKDEQILTIR